MFYRALADLPPRPNHAEPAATKGQLLFPWASSHTKPTPDHVAVTVRPDGYGGMIMADKAQLEPVAQPGWLDFPLLTEFYLKGRAAFPVLTIDETPKAVASTLDNMACCAGWTVKASVSSVLLPGMSSPIWCRAFLSSTQGGQLDGSGALLIYSGFRGDKVPRTARFAICEHEFVMGAGANPQRGWRPGHCAKCGLNMSVDSGD